MAAAAAGAAVTHVDASKGMVTWAKENAVSSAVIPQYGGHVEASEIGLPVTGSGLTLPCGASGRWSR
jgi:hypothetical protein